MPAGSKQRAAKASRHLASPSMGHYAALSFVVKGRGPGDCGLRICDMRYELWGYKKGLYLTSHISDLRSSLNLKRIYF